jgi:uncharacterized phage infection (PIP) family protein YhgE|tara:strand:+ start:116 stop:748 length:633 start_codon:yes stop_codon:yes gene_type:complete
MLLAAAVTSVLAFSPTAPVHGSHAGVASRSSVAMFEPVTTAVVAFAVGAAPPSLLLARKSAELQEAQDKCEKQNKEMSMVRESYMEMVAALEMQVEATDMQLVELVKSGTKKATELKAQMEELKNKYKGQITQLKELAGDYADKVELQQNVIKRKDDMVLAAQGESRALMQSMVALEHRLKAAEQALSEAQSTLSPDFFGNFFKKLFGGK